MTGQPWVERSFELGVEAAELPRVIERLREIPARMATLVRGLSSAVLTRRFEGAWSIQENVGHLLDLEPLGDERLDQLLTGVPTLKPADMTNRRTEEAGHNDRAIEDLLAEFSLQRAALVSRLEGLGADEVNRSALHPRLEQPMTVTDLFYFIAEHDDHHLARIREIVERFASPAEQTDAAS